MPIQSEDSEAETAEIEYKIKGEISYAERFTNFRKKTGMMPIKMTEFNLMSAE